MPKIDRIRAKAERLTERAAALEKRSAEQEAAQNANSADVVARFEAMAADQAARRAEISASIAAVATEMGELAAMLEEPPPPPPPPPPPATVDWWAKPFLPRAAHWRRVGAGATQDVPGGCHIVDWEAGRLAKIGKGFTKEQWERDLRPRIGDAVLGDTDQGRKGRYRAGPGDSDARGTDQPQVFQKCRGEGAPTIWLDETFRMRVPKGSIVRGGDGVYYPANEKGGDYTYLFTEDGVTVHMFTDFRGPSAATGWRMGYSSHQVYRLDGSDTVETPGDYKSAIRVRWPGAGVLWGEDVNAENPGPIEHCLNFAATRHNRKGATDLCQILSPEIVWPADSIDASCLNDWLRNGRSEENKGFLPMGAKLRIMKADLPRVLAAIGPANKRGQRIAEALCSHGAYAVDGHGQWVEKSGVKKGVLQFRIDNYVGRNPNGTEIPGVIDQCNAGLRACLPFLYPVGNPIRWSARGVPQDQELWTDGQHYSGGGGPL
jgi:hypothetical protein